MKIRLTKIAVSLLLTLMMLASSAIILVNADGTHGFYMDCDIGVVNKKADGFMIDFYSDADQALATYYSNANFSMYTQPTSKKFGYLGLSGGGGYAGMQILGKSEERTGIFSLWRYEYTDPKTRETKYIYAKAIYGKTTSFSNEGSGTSCVMPFDWKCGQWYREALYAWEDAETGYTFLGNWYYDYEADSWTLFAYYNTFLVDSYFSGGFGQFLENFNEEKRATERSFRYRNVYVLSHETGEWVSSPTVNLRSDANPKAMGEATLGVSEDGTYVWAKVDGKSKVDTDELLQIRPTLVQSEKPQNISVPVIDAINVKEKRSSSVNKWAYIDWTMNEHSTPQLSYKLEITDKSGNVLLEQYETRPHVQKIEAKNLGEEYTIKLTVTDIFGQTTEKSIDFVSSEILNPVTGENTRTPENTTIPAESGAEVSGAVIAVIAASVAAVIIIACAVFFILKKKKVK